MMKKISFFMMPLIILVACGSDSSYDKLQRLEAQRDALDQQISELKAEISGNTDPAQGKLLHVDIQQITPGLFNHYIKVQGTVESDNNILIPARSAGMVKKIYVERGMSVKKGKILAELDGAILENTLAELEVNLDMAKTMYERQKRLWEKKIGSEIQYLQAKATKESLEKRLAATREQYRMTKIIAPINGIVDQILIKEGESVGGGFGTIRVVQLSALKIEAGISEEHTGQIRVGDSVTVQIPVLNKELTSTIRSVSRVIDSQNRTFSIEIGLPKETHNIQPNMLAVLTIDNYSNPEALTVPVNIVQKTGHSEFLFTAQAQPGDKKSLWKSERRTVQTGKKYGDVVEIIAGLNAEEFVVIRGFQNLADEQLVLAELNDK
jgi:membrane fusion protein, multidrug efflux system